MKQFQLKKPEPLEKEIQATILQYLQARKIFCWKEHSGGVPMDGGKFFMPIGLKGKADILGILPGGRFLAIEVKRRSGVLSQDQKYFLDRVSQEGGVAFVAYSLDDVIEKLK